MFHCPNDQPGASRPEPNQGRSYFQSEKSSYEYRLHIGGATIEETVKRIGRFTDRAIPENMFWVMRDYDNFHGEAGKPGARRYLYIDGHVTDFEN